jgi:hypothetical protein
VVRKERCAFVTKIQLHVDKLTPCPFRFGLRAFNTIDEALRANLIALTFHPSASELMDHYISECTKRIRNSGKIVFLSRETQGPYWSWGSIGTANPVELEQQAKALEKPCVRLV